MPILRTFLIPSLALAAAAAAAIAAPGRPAEAVQSPNVHAEHRQALELFRQGSYAAAYGRLMRLADAGHVGAARLALVMSTQGKAMFGTELSATAAQQMRWNAQIVNHGRYFMPAPDLASGE